MWSNSKNAIERRLRRGTASDAKPREAPFHQSNDGFVIQIARRRDHHPGCGVVGAHIRPQHLARHGGDDLGRA